MKKMNRYFDYKTFITTLKLGGLIFCLLLLAFRLETLSSNSIFNNTPQTAFANEGEQTGDEGCCESHENGTNVIDGIPRLK